MAASGDMSGGGRMRGLLAGMRIRKKLIVLHTCFSLVLAGVLGLALKPAVSEVVKQAEEHEAALVLRTLLSDRIASGTSVESAFGPTVRVRFGTAEQLGIDKTTPVRGDGTIITRGVRGEPGVVGAEAKEPLVAAFDPRIGQYVGVSVVLQGARDAVVRLYVLMTLALLAVYALVAAALEIFVLPQHVYSPIRTMLAADAAVQEGRKDEELIPVSAMPKDELGEIMRSRNESIISLRKHQHELALALAQLEEVATDLKRKNHLLEMARQNLADADRLASLGMMSAGIAHELNTPLAVLKGLVEKLNTPVGVSTEESALMLRVVGRLERLSESLLDFARVRPAQSRPSLLRPLVDEAWTLVRLERGAGKVEVAERVPEQLSAMCDPGRIVQVLVNLLRNAVDAMASRNGAAGAPPRIEVEGQSAERDGRRWASLTITDNGPGIDAEMLSRLFQPFVSTRLDSKGTGLGLAVAEGIVREHGGVILARNRADAAGAVFEVMLPEPAAASGSVDLLVGNPPSVDRS